MKKILYITTVSRTINAFLIPHIEMLLADGHQVDCACCIDQEVQDVLLNKGVHIYPLPFTRNPLDLNNLKAFKQLGKLQQKNQYDIVHVHTPIAALYGRLLKMKFPQLKTIYTVHGFHFYKGAPFLNWAIYYPIEKVMAHFTDVMITMNEEDYERSQTFAAKACYHINGVGIDTKQFNIETYEKEAIRNELGLAQDDFVILMIAEVNANKNHKQMIEAVTILKERGIDVKVLCAGDGEKLEEIKELVAKKQLNSNIRMLGYRTDIQALIAACDIGMLLSYREGLPRNIMELMACGKPVIGTNIRGIRDLIDNEKTGFLVEVSDSEDTANRIEELVCNKQIRNDFAAQSLMKIEDYRIEKVNKQLEKIYMVSG
ncbi:MAG: glycosyltransferase family 4 protein [Bacillaceae bacterium]